MDQIRHKCGYCGWLFRFNTNFVDHDCFKHYIEEVDHIYIDENNIVTILKKNPRAVDRNENLDELLIEAVRSKRGFYDFCVPASERTMLRKNALWMEVSNILQGFLSPEEAKARWKYLRDNYIKARKKVQTYIPSGSAATAANTITGNKSKFQYYDLMRFLDDSLQTRQTVSSLTGASAKSEVVTSFDIGNEQQKDDVVTGPSRTLQISAINNSPQTSLYVSSRTPTPTSISPQALDSIGSVSIAHGAIGHVQSHRSVPSHFLVPTSKLPITSRCVQSPRTQLKPSRFHQRSFTNLDTHKRFSMHIN